MKCPNCGFESNDNLNFCGACGYRLNYTEVGDQGQRGVKNRDQMRDRNWRNYPESSPPPSPDNSYLAPDNDNGKKKNNRKKNKLIFIIVPILLIVLGLFELYLIQSKLKNLKLPKNPRIESDSSTDVGQKVTWDCIWFGAYPQTEIVDTPETSGVQGKGWEKKTDYEVNASLYNSLKSATGWDNNGDITLRGVKYRRIDYDSAHHGRRDNRYYYNWSDVKTYHYFRYEKIKWRVLKISGSSAFLIADQALDDQPYNEADEVSRVVPWDVSTIRSWLNGYNLYSNANGIDYSSKNFFGTAFTSAEQEAILTTRVKNDDNIDEGTDGGKDTDDKIFFLSKTEVYTDAAIEYGFTSERSDDEARSSKSSTYAKAMGVYSSSAGSIGGCGWWLRSHTHDFYADFVGPNGNVNRYGEPSYGINVNEKDYAVRPALNLNLSSSDLWSNAGTVCSDGTVDEIGGETSYEKSSIN